MPSPVRNVSKKMSAARIEPRASNERTHKKVGCNRNVSIQMDTFPNEHQLTTRRCPVLARKLGNFRTAEMRKLRKRVAATTPFCGNCGNSKTYGRSFWKFSRLFGQQTGAGRCSTPPPEHRHNHACRSQSKCVRCVVTLRSTPTAIQPPGARANVLVPLWGRARASRVGETNSRPQSEVCPSLLESCSGHIPYRHIP